VCCATPTGWVLKRGATPAFAAWAKQMPRLRRGHTQELSNSQFFLYPRLSLQGLGISSNMANASLAEVFCWPKKVALGFKPRAFQELHHSASGGLPSQKCEAKGLCAFHILVFTSGARQAFFNGCEPLAVGHSH